MSAAVDQLLLYTLSECISLLSDYCCQGDVMNQAKELQHVPVYSACTSLFVCLFTHSVMLRDRSMSPVCVECV